MRTVERKNYQPSKGTITVNLQNEQFPSKSALALVFKLIKINTMKTTTTKQTMENGVNFKWPCDNNINKNANEIWNETNQSEDKTDAFASRQDINGIGY